MSAPRAELRSPRYISGWCGSALHHRCKGSYAGTACCCPCHQFEQAVPTGAAAGWPERKEQEHGDV